MIGEGFISVYVRSDKGYYLNTTQNQYSHLIRVQSHV